MGRTRRAAVRGATGLPAPSSAAAPAPEPAAPTTDRIAALKDLADLKAQGILTDAEFESEKARILRVMRVKRFDDLVVRPRGAQPPVNSR